MKQFPTVHCHPQSFDSASTPAAMVKREVELGSGCMTCTDHGSMGACRTLYDLSRKNGLIFVAGIECYFRDDLDPLLIKRGIPRARPKKRGGAEDPAAPLGFSNYWKYGHLTIHFLDQQAYEAGVKVLSLAKTERHGSELKPIFTWKDLEELGGYNVTIGSGCLGGMVSDHLFRHDNFEIAQAYYERLRGVVKPGNFYAEVFPHDCSKYWMNGVFLEINSGSSQEKLKMSESKTLKTNLGEISAEELVEQLAKGVAHTELVGVKDWGKWVERQGKIVGAKRVKDFLPNECRPWCPDGDSQAGINRQIIEWAHKYGDPIVVSDDSHFARQDDWQVQDIRLLQGGRESWRFANSYHRQSSQEAFEHFKKTLGLSEKDFDGWVENNLAWANRFKGFELNYKATLPTKFYPADSFAHTLELIQRHGRMDWKSAAMVDRLKKEITLFYQNGKTDLLPYFFIAEEACALYEKNGYITGCGRGSAGGVLLSYLLGITHVNPLDFNLSLERFLTLDRIKDGAWPDIDLDFPHRDLLIDPVDPEKGWLKERFGNHAAPISTIGTLKLRAACKDVCRVKHGKVPPEVEALTKQFENAPQGVLDKDHIFGYQNGEEEVLGSIHTDVALQQFIKKYPQDWEVVQKLLGLSRNHSKHACAIAIANRPLHEFIPMHKVGDTTCTQYTMDGIEKSGILKMDFLRINSLMDISECVRLIQERSTTDTPNDASINGIKVPKARIVPFRGQFYDLWKLWLAPDSGAVFNDICEGKTETVFQFNTTVASQNLVFFNKKGPNGKKLINSIEDMAIFTALGRKGPLDAFVTLKGGQRRNMLMEYCARALGQEKSPDIPEIFEELFPETHSVLVFQEQLQHLYQQLMGCSGSEAEEFRRDVGKKKTEKLLKLYPGFIEQVSKKTGEEKAKVLWQTVIAWSGYGFCQTHAVEYSITAFACAFLKHHFPLEWWCAVLKNAEKNEINEKFWGYCGHLIDLPDVTRSRESFEIVEGRIRAPVNLLHGIGPGAHAQLLKHMPYRDIDDFCEKIQRHKHLAATKKTMLKNVTVKTARLGPDGKPLKNGRKGVYDYEDKQVEVERTRLGSSSLHRGVCYALIISGAMDELFPKTQLLTQEKLELYEAAIAKATGKRASAVRADCVSINQIQRFQLRKEILPVYAEPLAPMFADRKIASVSRKGEDIVYQGEIPFPSLRDFKKIEGATLLPGSIRFALGVYVESTRTFTYHGDKKACELIFDFEGEKIKQVAWPLNGHPSKLCKESLSGSVGIVLLEKRSDSAPIRFLDFIVVEPPIQPLEDEDK